jgi:hypothetical protein
LLTEFNSVLLVQKKPPCGIIPVSKFLMMILSKNVPATGAQHSHKTWHLHVAFMQRYRMRQPTVVQHNWQHLHLAADVNEASELGLMRTFRSTTDNH